MFFWRIFNKKIYQYVYTVKMTVGREGSGDGEDRIEFIKRVDKPPIYETKIIIPITKSTRKNSRRTSRKKIKCKNKEQYWEYEMDDFSQC